MPEKMSPVNVSVRSRRLGTCNPHEKQQAAARSGLLPKTDRGTREMDDSSRRAGRELALLPQVN